MSHFSETVDSVVDREKLIDQVCGSTELLREIADIFLGNFPGQIREIVTAINSNDCDRVRELGHLLKGSLGNFHAPAAVEAAFQLEVVGRENRLTEAASLVKRLETEVQRVEFAIGELC